GHRHSQTATYGIERSSGAHDRSRSRFEFANLLLDFPVQTRSLDGLQPTIGIAQHQFAAGTSHFRIREVLHQQSYRSGLDLLAGVREYNNLSLRQPNGV